MHTRNTTIKEYSESNNINIWCNPSWNNQLLVTLSTDICNRENAFSNEDWIIRKSKSSLKIRLFSLWKTFKYNLFNPTKLNIANTNQLTGPTSLQSMLYLNLDSWRTSKVQPKMSPNHSSRFGELSLHFDSRKACRP